MASTKYGMRARGRLRTFALVVVAAVVAAGCTRGAGGDKAGGGGEQVVLRLANYSGNLDGEPAMADFIKRVGELSGGNVRIEVFSDWGTGITGVEQQVVRDVEADNGVHRAICIEVKAHSRTVTLV